MRAHLTDVGVRALKPATKQFKVWDTQTRGFGVLVSDTTKTWFVMYSEKRRFKSLGRWPDVSLSEARRKAQGLLGTQPDAARCPTFPVALDLFLDTHAAELRPRSRYVLERTLRFNFHWTKTLDKITHNDVLTAIESKKAKSAASHALKDIRTFFNWCVPRYLAHSPCQGIKMPSRYIPRKRVLTDEELKKVWFAATEYPFGSIVRLLITSGQRKTETASIKWDYVNGQEQTITLPDWLTKNGREHRFPIGSYAQDIIKSLPRKGDYLFEGRVHDQPYNGWNKHKADLDKKSGVQNWVLHDLRRTYRTIHGRIGTPPHVGERLINHISGIESVTSEVNAIYDVHTYLPEMRKAVEAFDGYLSQLLKRP
jgi:integrase